MYPKDKILDIVKIETNLSQHRIRGQVAKTLDWVSIMDTSDSFMWLKPVSDVAFFFVVWEGGLSRNSSRHRQKFYHNRYERLLTETNFFLLNFFLCFGLGLSSYHFVGISFFATLFWNWLNNFSFLLIWHCNLYGILQLFSEWSKKSNALSRLEWTRGQKISNNPACCFVFFISMVTFHFLIFLWGKSGRRGKNKWGDRKKWRRASNFCLLWMADFQSIV